MDRKSTANERTVAGINNSITIDIFIFTASVEATRSVLDDYTDRYADYFPDAYVKFKQLDYQKRILSFRGPFHGRRYRPVEAGRGFLDGRVA